MFPKTFRLFVSSTFSDFIQEREVLQSDVFPEIESYCLTKGYQFYAIDLRWGINEKAYLSQKIVELCLDEVHAVKDYPQPNLFVMLGDRYGWVPLPFAIPADEFNALIEWLCSNDQLDEADLLSHIYQHDKNYLLPKSLISTVSDHTLLTNAYILRSRFSEIEDMKNPGVWNKTEHRARKALQRAAINLEQLGLIESSAKKKYFRSITEQEICVGLDDIDDKNLSAQSFTATTNSVSHALIFIREFKSKLVQEDTSSESVDERRQIDVLKKHIKSKLSASNIVTLTTYNRDNELSYKKYLDDFRRRSFEYLKLQVDMHIGQTEAIENSPQLEIENECAQQLEYAALKRRIFVGQKQHLEIIASYLVNTECNYPLVIHGRSGYGKSALLACAIAEATAKIDFPVVYRFAGASAMATDFRSLWISLLTEMETLDIFRIPKKFEEESNSFTEQIRDILLSIEVPIIIFVDAVDQLQDSSNDSWITDTLPKNVKLIVSVINDPKHKASSEVYRILRSRLEPHAFLEIQPLGVSEGKKILAELEKAANRHLQAEQRRYVMDCFSEAGRSPLYMRTAFAIVCNWRSLDKPGDGTVVLAKNLPSLIEQFIRDLTEIHHNERILIERTLGFLVASRDGLSEKELTELLARDDEVMSIVAPNIKGPQPKLPASVWSRLYRQLSPFLIVKLIDEQPLIGFYHREIALIAASNFYNSSKIELHSALSSYFESRRQGKDARYDRRSLSELPYQLFHAKKTTELSEILISPDWLKQKVAAFDIRRVIDDYVFANSRSQKLVLQALKLASGAVSRDESQLLPQLHGRLGAFATETGIKQLRCEIKKHLPEHTILTRTASLTQPGYERSRLEGHFGTVTAILALSDELVASASKDMTIRIWDVTKEKQLKVMRGHNPVLSLESLPDYKLLAIEDCKGGDKESLRIWNIANGCEEGCISYTGKNRPTVTALLSDRRLLLGTEQGTVFLWNIETNRMDSQFEAHNCKISALAILSNNQFASGADDGSIYLWDINSKTVFHKLHNQGGQVLALVALSNGNLVSSSTSLNRKEHRSIGMNFDLSSLEGTLGYFGSYGSSMSAFESLRGSTPSSIQIWDTKVGKIVKQLDEVHLGWSTSLIALSDDRLAVSSTDCKVHFIDLTKGTKECMVLEGHTGGVNSVIELSDQKLVTCSDDATIRIWEASNQRVESKSHNAKVNAISVLSIKYLASGSDDCSIKIWDCDSLQQISHTDVPKKVNALATLPGEELASGDADGSIRVWHTKGEQLTNTLENNSFKSSRYGGQICALTLMQNGQLASGADDGSIWLWSFTKNWFKEGAAGRIGPCHEGNGASFWSLTELNDGSLASGSDDESVRIWTPEKLSKTQEFPSKNETTDPPEFLHLRPIMRGIYFVNALAQLPNGWIVAGANDGTIRLFDRAKGNEISGYHAHGGQVRAFCLLEDGRLVSGGDDRRVRIWNIPKEREEGRIEVDSPVLCLATLRNGSVVAGDQLGQLHWLEILN